VQLKKFGVFYNALLKTEKITAGRISFIGCRLSEQPAKVVEMLLVSSRFLALIARPFLFEFGGGHGSVANSASFSRIGMVEASVRRKCGGGK
jgi:hypothetical protein